MLALLFQLGISLQMFAGSKDFVGLVLFGTPGEPSAANRLSSVPTIAFVEVVFNMWSCTLLM